MTRRKQDDTTEVRYPQRQTMKVYPDYHETEFISFDTPMGTVSVTYTVRPDGDEELLLHVSCEREHLKRVRVLDDWGMTHELEGR